MEHIIAVRMFMKTCFPAALSISVWNLGMRPGAKEQHFRMRSTGPTQSKRRGRPVQIMLSLRIITMDFLCERELIKLMLTLLANR